ncbi:hypothetical protein [Methylocella tundrae]|uniref:Uncharacterized protein n=1 Tax=Methylocella tundrae TaxID=227605 RepID=A0A4U8YW91_METTU|nr:hypothetical protein [Methylocella tundrae]WPP04799.1 hypothetical protein SIN04_02920 [Methylocella tundrae]VFU07030.1 conserved protein of unknown function [Methylocella tundrae]
MFEWLRGFWTRHIAQDVPIDLARCEFGCRVRECRRGEWERCENRLLDVQRQIAYAEAASPAEPPPHGHNASPEQRKS